MISYYVTMMNNVLRQNVGQFCVVYLADIFICSTTHEERLLRYVKTTIRELHQQQFHVKLSKLVFGRKSVEFVGHIVKAVTLQMDNRKLEAIQN
jgi:hypothetical protein